MRITDLFENNLNVIDNKNGWGAVPNNQEVDYLGLRVMMSPKTFIDLAAPLDGEPSNEIFKHIQNGGKIGSPFLIIEIPESWTDGDLSMPARVVGHEGRNRMLAIEKAIGNAPIEVHLFFSQGLRNRHITDDMKKMLNKGLVKEKSKSIVRGPLFSLTESIREDGRIVKGVNTTVDVGPDEIKTQSAKFGNRVDKDGFPPFLRTDGKLSENKNLYIDVKLLESINPEILKPSFHKETVVDTKAGPTKIVATHYPSNMIPQIKVEAFINNVSVGYVRFIVMGNEEPTGLLKRFKKVDPYLLAGNLRVDDEYQRKGIATAMYKFVKSLGNDIKPSTTQTDKGKAFWTSKPAESEEPRYTAKEWAIMEGGHSLEEKTVKPKLFDWNKY